MQQGLIKKSSRRTYSSKKIMFIYDKTYYSSMHVRVIRLYQGPSTRASATGTDDEPANK
jgi:hypothetical protein